MNMSFNPLEAIREILENMTKATVKICDEVSRLINNNPDISLDAYATVINIFKQVIKNSFMVIEIVNH